MAVKVLIKSVGSDTAQTGRGLVKKRSRSLYMQSASMSHGYIRFDSIALRDKDGTVSKRSTGVAVAFDSVDYSAKVVAMKKTTTGQLKKPSKTEKDKLEGKFKPKSRAVAVSGQSAHFQNTDPLHASKKMEQKDPKLAKAPFAVRAGKNKVPQYRNARHLIFFIFICLLNVSQGQVIIIKTSQNLQDLDNCWSWFERHHFCPQLEDETAYLNHACCSHLHDTLLHCLEDEFKNSTQYILPACLPPEIVMNGMKAKLIVKENGDPALEIRPCEKGHFATENRSSQETSSQYCLQHSTCYQEYGKYILCQGHATADNMCGCLPGYEFQGSDECRYGFHDNMYCRCEKKSCREGEMRNISVVSAPGLCGTFDIPFQNDTCVPNTRSEKNTTDAVVTTTVEPAVSASTTTPQDAQNNHTTKPLLWVFLAFFGAVFLIFLGIVFVLKLQWRNCLTIPPCHSDPRLLNAAELPAAGSNGCIQNHSFQSEC